VLKSEGSFYTPTDPRRTRVLRWSFRGRLLIRPRSLHLPFSGEPYPLRSGEFLVPQSGRSDARSQSLLV
jgi:hypothetical protein